VVGFFITSVYHQQHCIQHTQICDSKNLAAVHEYATATLLISQRTTCLLRCWRLHWRTIFLMIACGQMVFTGAFFVRNYFTKHKITDALSAINSGIEFKLAR
jgi:hypothetical protein